ncbi:hypothetical protein [Frigoriflavimonas asaccharolytica]|uniref:Uncharacterized protein n=1 Tax=Frigoriflavimonas asaccharolytica TaxID=2735899 RepID=A0A8J8G5J0_9FLAO|nr:hypothetical protein [Frigoriflavimonas asaccharolytica]NRS91644.1 hypothetical protein [Frigoriflavimonas asaccharolytica]
MKLVEESVKNFDAEASADLIKAEKFLKAQAKIEDDISVYDVDSVLNLYKLNGNSFGVLLKDNSILQILNAETTDLKNKSILASIENDEILENFAQIFEGNIKDFIQKNILVFGWGNLKYLAAYFRKIISSRNLEFLKTQISSKNQTIISIFPFPEKYKFLDNEYKYANDIGFFQLQSVLDPLFFEEDIRKINNTSINFQKTDKRNKFYLGRIMMAIYGYKTDHKNLADVLRGNYSVGANWVNSYKSSTYKVSDLKHVRYFDLLSYFSHRKTTKTKEIIILIMIYGMLILTVSPFFIRDYKFLGLALLVEFILYLIFNKKLSKNFEKHSKTQNDFSFYRKFKKFTYNFINLNLFLLIVAICILIIVTVVATLIAVPHSIVIFGVLIYKLIRNFNKR